MNYIRDKLNVYGITGQVCNSMRCLNVNLILFNKSYCLKEINVLKCTLRRKVRKELKELY